MRNSSELRQRIWKVANEVRGAVDGRDFKQYIFGTLFYRFISENFAAFMENGDESVIYSEVPYDIITPDIKADVIKTKGYFIYPNQLFKNVLKNIDSNENLSTDLHNIFKSIESSAKGYPSENNIKGIFSDFDTTSDKLGMTAKARNARLAKVLKGIGEIDFGDYGDHEFDLLGDTYEYLIGKYAANSGIEGGEFFTPQNVSKLIAEIAVHGLDKINAVYDPTCGSGSLLMCFKDKFKRHIIEDGFFGQEINHTTYNLARMNMFLHNIDYDKFDIKLGDTLIDPKFGNQKPFDAIVSNPPYSLKWVGSDNPALINDERFAPADVLAPKSKADFAFVMHALSYLSHNGRAAIVCFPGIFHRGGVEKKIRQYLIDNNYIETIIALPPNLFFGTTIAVDILVLSKHKKGTATQFIDASTLFKKEGNNNVLTNEHREKIIALFDNKEDVPHLSKSVSYEDIKANDYNLSVSCYVQAKDTREVIDITQLNAEIKATVSKIDQLRTDIDAIIAEIE